uniref:Uncharacterized protein n=1 Tax=viral metagenome TaxID=1070528 RepID=A0A6M3Y203_9ZZZZ
MKVIIDGVAYIPEPVISETKPKPEKGIMAKNDIEAARLYYSFEPLCPECGDRAVPTNFPPKDFGGEKDDKRNKTQVTVLLSTRRLLPNKD